MSELLSVGLDVGTTSTQLILSRLTVENRASGFTVPQMQITDRQVVYESPVHFTPLTDDRHVDGAAIRALVAAEYAKAGIQREAVDTGAIIITGETSRKENAATVLRELSGFAGEFVVATAGPDLESVLSAKGAGAVQWSAQTGKTVLHMDIGGGTSNLSLIRDGRIVRTGCLNVGGRLIKLSEGQVTYVSPVVLGLTDLQVGDRPQPGQLEDLARQLTMALEMAAGLRSRDRLLDELWTREAGEPFVCTENAVISFSGGVADCIEVHRQDDAFGDIGPVLGRAIRGSRLCSGAYRLGSHTIRATVIGAGCHSTSLSGSTVFCRGIELPVQDLSVLTFTAAEQAGDLAESIAARLRRQDAEQTVLAMPGYHAPDYPRVRALAEAIIRGTAGRPVLVCLEGDMAKALGHCISLLQPGVPCLCMDRLHLQDGSYLDVGKPVGPALPVVIKTLILANQ